MQHLLGRRPSPATVISLVALFVALGGTGYAAVQLAPKNSVGSGQVINGSLQKVDLSKKAVAALKGNRGARGPAGAAGAAGAVGAAGAAGPAGATGPAGPAGATGPSGAVGATGVTGASGPTRPAGTAAAFAGVHATGASSRPPRLRRTSRPPTSRIRRTGVLLPRSALHAAQRDGCRSERVRRGLHDRDGRDQRPRRRRIRRRVRCDRSGARENRRRPDRYVWFE